MPGRCQGQGVILHRHQSHLGHPSSAPHCGFAQVMLLVAGSVDFVIDDHARLRWRGASNRQDRGGCGRCNILKHLTDPVQYVCSSRESRTLCKVFFWPGIRTARSGLQDQPQRVAPVGYLSCRGPGTGGGPLFPVPRAVASCRSAASGPNARATLHPRFTRL